MLGAPPRRAGSPAARHPPEERLVGVGLGRSGVPGLGLSSLLALLPRVAP